eukprot:CAMPEP_0114593230 /NCGR_PEP_ID=MMETSP0125-20121206/14859_1 /TAXON_ID=485358 ORGANISM="Aristerostoma sp., Strain ATCC 50986" /NCGR_SAMPLE_ID=MMETSP0125 /ASSEMBLY_ACC=CAM_ASM_000245 /LENGTH=138 /DNA_ID=CAMNT_0001792271 /DNA_START=199 /DNA_END=616 /DNA_ORIENTATION=+
MLAKELFSDTFLKLRAALESEIKLQMFEELKQGQGTISDFGLKVFQEFNGLNNEVLVNAHGNSQLQGSQERKAHYPQLALDIIEILKGFTRDIEFVVLLVDDFASAQLVYHLELSLYHLFHLGELENHIDVVADSFDG